MKYKYGDKVKLNDEFYGEIEGTVIDRKNSEGLFWDVYEYLIKFKRKGKVMQKWFNGWDIK